MVNGVAVLVEFILRKMMQLDGMCGENKGELIINAYSNFVKTRSAGHVLDLVLSSRV